jgi:hypothetical protein
LPKHLDALMCLLPLPRYLLDALMHLLPWWGHFLDALMHLQPLPGSGFGPWTSRAQVVYTYPTP